MHQRTVSVHLSTGNTAKETSMSVFTNTSLLTPLLEQAVQHCSKLYQLSTPLLEQSVQHSVRRRRSPLLEQAVQHCSRGIHAVVVHIATRGNSIEDLKRGQGTVAADYCFRFAELENNHSLCLQSSSPAHHHRTQEAQPSPTGMWSLRTSWNRCGKHSTGAVG